ncbi:MAG: hypothetical protein AMXMBFR7_35150 [Planctomycetota bacterium]
MLGNLGDMMKLMGQAGQIKKNMAEMQERAKRRVVEGSSGGGLVKVRANGIGEVLSVEIDPEALKDSESLGPLIAAATNAALRGGREAMLEETKQALGGMELPPGLLPG